MPIIITTRKPSARILCPPAPAPAMWSAGGSRPRSTAAVLSSIVPPPTPAGCGRRTNSNPPPLAPVPGETPGWRGPKQSGAFAATVGDKPKERWRYTPAHPFDGDLETRRYDQENRYTPPVLSGGLLFLGGTDGGVRAIDMATGAFRWEAWTAGPIYAPPTVEVGRLYVGSGDGSIFCYEVATGRSLWRFRAAVQERLIGVNGHISSNWPVHTGVLLHDGVAYAGAGLLPEDGTQVYALDARDGHLLWQNYTLGDHPDQHNAGRSPLGGMTIAGGRLWLQCLGSAATALDLKTGVLLPLPQRFDDERKTQGVIGKDMFNFQNQWVLAGGQRLLADHYERVGSYIKIGRWARYDFLKLAPDGTPQWPALSLPETIQAPVWDDRLFVTPTTYRSHLEGWSMAKFLPYLEQLREKSATIKKYAFAPERFPILKVERKENEATPMRLWGPLDLDVNALALGADAVVVTHRVAVRNQPVAWRLSVLERDTGRERWSLNLPGEPLMDGLVLDCTGHIIVPLLDGGVLCFGRS